MENLKSDRLVWDILCNGRGHSRLFTCFVVGTRYCLAIFQKTKTGFLTFPQFRLCPQKRHSILSSSVWHFEFSSGVLSSSQVFVPDRFTRILQNFTFTRGGNGCLSLFSLSLSPSTDLQPKAIDLHRLPIHHPHRHRLYFVTPLSSLFLRSFSVEDLA
ncbi:hypothetical protein RHGRI_006501 [Rhododendron griersonianum]|uniref:Uncharacterized protein n=1 Tax=Rhododendron griersonianum TaxID=479676 RepID=A0AAV6KUD4_9ERIC|nr:hypothetical protein RHGRI_006501 [Rhododendron griersonianum]